MASSNTCCFVDGSKPGLFYEDGIGWYGIAGSKSGLDWFGARDMCQKMNGELVTVNGADTQEKVASFLIRHGK